MPTSSLASLTSPAALHIIPPRLPPPAKPARQRSRLSEGERLQLEEVKRDMPSSSPQSADDSPALDWNHVGRASRARAKPTPANGPNDDEPAQQQQQQPGQAARKRGRGIGEMDGKQGGERKEESKAEADTAADVNIMDSKKRRRGSTSSR